MTFRCGRLPPAPRGVADELGAMKTFQAGENLLAERVNHYITDGAITSSIL
jgi:hypothetical protein